MTDFETHPIGTAKRIKELEAKLEALDHAYDSIVQALQFEGLRTDEAEAKLAKVVAVLHSIVDQRGYADDPWGIVQSALAELKGETNGKD